MRVVFVHGACVKDGSWWWHRTGELLAERGVASEAPALPSCGETGEPTDAGGPGLAEDVAAVRHVLTADANRYASRKQDHKNQADQDPHSTSPGVPASSVHIQRWCPGPDSNRHDVVTRRGILSPLCLPVSPPGLAAF